MKKYVVLVFILFFMFLLLSNNDDSYAYVDCSNTILIPEEVTTLNLSDYMAKIEFNEFKNFCSYDNCYDIREGNIKTSIKNFRILFDKKLSEEEKYEIDVKGYPITKIVIDVC